jgi:hypothetical protein
MFNLGPPIGFGLSYLIGLVSNDLFGPDWRYTLRFTQILLILMLLLILAAYQEPVRGGQVEQRGESDVTTDGLNNQPDSLVNDLKKLLANKTYVLLVVCWTLGLASLGAFSWYSSSIIQYSLNDLVQSDSGIFFIK